jgi:uncharacterized protein (UPF0332 family)
VKEFTRQRLEKAAAAIEAARLLADEGFHDAAADRAYYAMFFAVEGLLSERDLSFSRHGAVHGAFGRLFAKTGELDPKYHRWLLEAFDARQTATYGAEGHGPGGPEAVGLLIDQADQLSAAIQDYLADGL